MTNRQMDGGINTTAATSTKKRGEKMRKKRKVTFCGCLILSLLLSAGCGDGGDGKSNEQSPDDTGNEQAAWIVRQDTPPGEFEPENIEGVVDDLVDALNQTEQQVDMKLAVISKVMSDYFQIASMGGSRAIAELGVIGSVTAADSYEEVEDAVAAQIDIIESLVDEGYKGLAIAPFTTDVIDTIDEAVDADSVVVTFDSDLEESKRQFYLGTDNRASGKIAGETLVGFLGEDVGTVVVLGHEATDWMGGYDRTMGSVEAIENAGNTVVIRQVDWGDPEGNVAFMSEALQTADPPAVGMIGMFSNAFQCVEAAEAAGMIDDIKIVTFDFEVDTLQYMQDGKIQATHAQRQYYMGYLAPYIMYAVNVLGLDETKALLEDITVGDGILDTGIDVIASDKVDAYNDFLDDLGILN
jgi:ribose transport system substrate-binding protein